MDSCTGHKKIPYLPPGIRVYIISRVDGSYSDLVVYILLTYGLNGTFSPYFSRLHKEPFPFSLLHVNSKHSTFASQLGYFRNFVRHVSVGESLKL